MGLEKWNVYFSGELIAYQLVEIRWLDSAADKFDLEPFTSTSGSVRRECGDAKR